MRLELLHPLPSLGTTAAAVAFALTLGSGLRSGVVFGIAAVVLLSQLSISALNDWMDRDRDAIAGRDRPLPLGLIDPRAAAAVAGLFGIGSLIGALRYGPVPAIVLTVGLVAGWSYDLWLKPTPLSVVPFAIAFPLLPTWVGLILGTPWTAFIWVIMAGVFFGAAIHLADSLPDLDVDEQAGLRPLAVVLGRGRSSRAIVLCIAVAGGIAAVSLRSTALVAAVVVLGSAVAIAGLSTVGFRRPASVRWITAGVALGTALLLLASLRHA